MTRVLIVDDHAVVRRGLREILKDAPGCTLVGEAERGGDALTILRREACDVMLLDLTLPDGSGLDVLKQVRLEFPGVAVLVLTMHAEEQYAVRAFRAGARGYLTKESAPEELLAAVRRLAAGGRYLSASLAERLASQLGSDDDRLPHERLSDREFQVMTLIAAGKGLSEIGVHLGISVKTVSTHRTRLLTKMGFVSNADVVRYAVQHNLLA